MQNYEIVPPMGNRNFLRHILYSKYISAVCTIQLAKNLLLQPCHCDSVKFVIADYNYKEIHSPEPIEGKTV